MENYTTRRWPVVIMIVGIALAGCTTTIRQQKEAQLSVITAALDQSTSTLTDIKSGALPPANDIHVFVRNDLFNKALAGLDNFSFDLPNDSSIKVNIDAIRMGTYGALPTMSIKAHAAKDALTADIDITAVLTASDPNQPGAMKLQVLSFTPVVKWYFFEFTKAKFVKALLAVELNKIADKLPVIQLPIAKSVSLGAPDKVQHVTVPSGNGSTLELDVDAPSTLKQRQLKVVRYVFLESGIHVFGVLQ